MAPANKMANKYAKLVQILSSEGNGISSDIDTPVMATNEELEQRIAKLEADNAELRRTVKLLNWRIIAGLSSSTTEISWYEFNKYLDGSKDDQFKE